MALAVVRRVGGLELREPSREGVGDARDVARIALDVRITLRVDVALRAIEARGLAQQGHGARGLEVTRRARPHLRVRCLLDHERQPSHLELGAGGDHEIGRPRARDEARTRLDAMRILQGGGGGVDLHLVPAQLLGERAPFGDGGEHVELGQGGTRRTEDDHQYREDQGSHGRLLNTCGRRAPPGSGCTAAPIGCR
jgi:hypothetical protein